MDVPGGKRRQQKSKFIFSIQERDMKRYTKGVLAAAAALIVAGCVGYGGGDRSVTRDWNPRGIADIPIPEYRLDGDNINVDLAVVTGGRYYFTSRMGGAVYAIDTTSMSVVKRITGEGDFEFSGCRNAQ